MQDKQLSGIFAGNARYYERGIWNGNAERPRYAIRTPAGILLTADDIAVLREKFDAHMREDEYGLTRQDYDELDPPEGGD